MSVKKTTNGHLMLLIQEIVKPIRLIKASPSPLSRREATLSTHLFNIITH